MTQNRNKTGKKRVRKKRIKDEDIAGEIAKVKPRKKVSQKKKTLKKVQKKKLQKKNALKKSQKKKTLKKIKPKTKKKADNFEKKVIDILEKVATKPPLNIIPDTLEKPIEPEDTGNNQNKILSDNIFHNAPGTNFFIILYTLSIILFMVGGYVYPATLEDISNREVIWADNGIYDRGLFSQFYTSIAFTFGLFLLGYYLNVTFIRFNVKKWNYFASGILLLFIFGLAKIGELIYDHGVFSSFKDLVLPVALSLVAYASYKIYKDLNGVVR